MGLTEKTEFRGSSRKTIYRGDCLKRGAWTVWRFVPNMCPNWINHGPSQPKIYPDIPCLSSADKSDYDIS